MASKSNVQDAVDAIIPQRLSFSADGGRVDQASAFTEIREITLTLLALDPNASLHLVRIARDKVLSAASDELIIAQNLRVALTDLKDNSEATDIRDTDSLGDAEAALVNLQSDVASGFITSDNVNAAKTQIDTFLNTQIAPNVRLGGSEIITRSEARRQIREFLPSLVTAHTETLRLLLQLEQLFAEFTAANVRALVGNSVVERSRTALSRIRASSDFDPAKSATSSSKHLADLVTVKRILTSYFEGADPLDPRLIGDSTTDLQAKLVGTGTPATLQSSSDVRPLVTLEAAAKDFDVTANGTSTSVDLVAAGLGSIPGEMFGTESGTFDTTTFSTFTLSIDQGAPVVVTLTVGAAVTRATIVSNINTAVGSTVAFDSVFDGKSVILLRSTTNGRDSHILIGTSNATELIGFGPSTLDSGEDPSLEDVAVELNRAQTEYTAEVEDASPSQTPLVSTSTGVIVAGILTDVGVADFLAAGVEGGDTVTFSSGPNDGLLLPVARVVAGQVHLDGVEDDTAIIYTIVRENRRMRLTSTDNSLVSELDVDTGSANARLGFTGAETADGTFPFVQVEKQVPSPPEPVDTGLFGVLPGDEFEITGSGTFTVVGLTTVAGEPAVEVTPEVPLFTGIADFEIRSFGAVSFKAFIDEPVDPTKTLPAFILNDLPVNGYNISLRILEDSIAQALNDASKAATAIALLDDLTGLLDDVTGLESILPTYTAAEVEALRTILDTLEEHNFDRFLKLLTEGFVTDALAVTAADFSFAAQLQSAARTVNTEELGV